MENGCRILSYVPLAVIVRPHSTDCQAASKGHAGIPLGCIPVLPMTGSFSVYLPHPQLVGGKLRTSLHITRKGIPLGDGYAVTDFFVQVSSLIADWVASPWVPLAYVTLRSNWLSPYIPHAFFLAIHPTGHEFQG